MQLELPVASAGTANERTKQDAFAPIFARLRTPESATFEEERRRRKERLAGGFRILAALGLAEGVAGHITARDPEETDTFWVNPFGLGFDRIRVSDLIRVDAEGEVVEGTWPVNVSAFAIHAHIHSARPEVVSAVGLVLQSPAFGQGLPTRVGQCSTTRVKWVGTRLDNTPGSGSAIQFMNGGLQVSYDQVAAVDRSRPGDPVRMCLISIPKECPPGDNRGRVYETTNLRARGSWSLPDAEHMCGGA